jgi:predicted secreted protein
MALSVNDKTTIYGDRLELTFNGKPLAFGKGCQLEVTAETLDTSNKMSGDWMEYLVGKLSFTLSSNALLTYSDATEAPELADVAKYGDLLATFIKRNPIDFSLSKIKKVEGGGFTKDFDLVSGKVIITQLSADAPDGQITTCSVNLQGTGELKIGEKFAGTAIGEATE